MNIGKNGARRRLGTAAAATLICFLSALSSGASSTLGGVVLTGGTLTLDFADPSNNSPTTTYNRLDVMNWSGGTGALTGQNLVFRGPNTSVDTCVEPVSSFGQTSYLYPGELSEFANLTALTMTVITTGGCGYFAALDLDYSQTTVYTAFPPGDADVNEFRVQRTFPSFNLNTLPRDGGVVPYPFNPQYMGYVPAVSSTLFGTVLYPNTAGTITTAQPCNTFVQNLYNLTAGCEVSDWKGTWFADDNGSGSGIVIFRDASSTTPAVLNVFFPPPVNVDFFNGNANQNLTMIALRPTADAQGSVASFAETEWVCAYDPMTWPVAAREYGLLPTGCAQHNPTSSVSPQFAFTPVINVAPGAVITSNVVHIPAIGTSNISITGGSYSLNGGAYTTATQVFSGNADLAVQVTSSASIDNEFGYGESVATVTINDVSSQFLVVSTSGPAVTVEVNPTTITLGQQATLSWAAGDVNTCTAGGAWTGAQNDSGSIAVTPTTTGTFTYSLTCTEDPPDDSRVHTHKTHSMLSHTSDTTYPSVSGSATLTVVAGNASPAPTVTLAANPTSVTAGTASTLTWSSTNATSCTASGAWTGPQATSGTSTQTPSSAGANTYALMCTGAGGSANASATVTATAVVIPAPTVTLGANPTSVTVGTASTLTWSSSNATTCTASGAWTGAEATSGTSTQTSTSAGTDTYTLTCTGAGGSSTASATVTANAPPLPTVTLTVDPTSVTVGTPSTLTWSSTNATACTASGSWNGTQATSGSSAESPTTAGSDVFTLTCTGAGGSANASATLTVNAPQAVVSTSSGRIGGGGAMDLASVLGLLSLTWLVRGVARRPAGLRLMSFLTVAMAGALLLGPFQARAADEFAFDFTHSYIGLRAGESIYQPSVNSILNSVGPDAADISSLSINRHQFGGVVYAGVPIWRSLSLEIGYAQIGQFPLSLTTVTAGSAVPDARVRAFAPHAQVRAIASAANVDTIAQEVVEAAPPAGHGVTLGFALPVEITSRISVEPHVAALVYQSKQTLSTPDGTLRDDRRGAGFDVGGSVTARLVGSLYAGAGVDCFHETRACNTVLLEGVIVYRFGR